MFYKLAELSVVNKLLNWVLYTSLFAAICAVGMCMATERLILQTIPPLFTSLHMLVMGSTLFVYNVHYIIKKSTPEVSDRFAWSQHHGFWHLGGLLTGVLFCIISLFYLPLNILLACGILGVLSFAYSLPLLPFEEKKRFKDFGLLKIFLLTTVWTIVTSILPMLYWGKQPVNYPYEILIRFVFMFTLCIAFDIRDMETDLDNKIFTLPNRIGLTNSYRIMTVFMILFAALSIVQYLRYPSLVRLSGELITAICTKLVIDYAHKRPSDKVYLGLVDGMMLLYSILLLLH